MDMGIPQNAVSSAQTRRSLMERIGRVQPRSVPVAAPAPAREQTPAEWLEQRIVRGAKERFCEEVSVTPVLAAEMMKLQKINRQLKAAEVAEWARRMASGSWLLTSEGIAFNKLGELQNGQHRLTAIQDSGCTVPITVWFGREKNEFEVIDQGRMRDAADLIAIDGKGQSITIASVTRLVLRVETKDHVSPRAPGVLARARALDDEMMRKALAIADRARRLMPQSTGAFAAYTIFAHTQRSHDVVEMFWNAFIAGGTPALVKVRDAIAALRLRKINTRDRSVKITALVIMAWNHFIGGSTGLRSLPKLEWKQTVFLPDVV